MCVLVLDIVIFLTGTKAKLLYNAERLLKVQ